MVVSGSDQDMLDESVLGLLGPGRALIVGTVDETGAPRATRAWGVRVVDAVDGLLRVLVDADDEVVCSQLASGCRVALGGTAVLSHESLQVKGESLGLEPADEADLRLHDDHIDTLVERICRVDHRRPEVVARTVPARVVVMNMRTGEAFDQTAGPDAGCRLAVER